MRDTKGKQTTNGGIWDSEEPCEEELEEFMTGLGGILNPLGVGVSSSESGQALTVGTPGAGVSYAEQWCDTSSSELSGIADYDSSWGF